MEVFFNLLSKNDTGCTFGIIFCVGETSSIPGQRCITGAHVTSFWSSIQRDLIWVQLLYKALTDPTIIHLEQICFQKQMLKHLALLELFLHMYTN